jgi:hypothetical protein
MATTPEFMMRRLARRVGGSDLSKMASEYSKQITGLTNQYQSEFSDYQKSVAEKMAPYESAVAQYQTKVEPQYQDALAGYNKKLASYQQQLAEMAANPVTERVERVVVGRTWYGKKKWGDAYFYDPKPIPTFDEKAPEIPNAPTAPTIEAFNTTPFDEKRKQLGEGMSRETSERKASRMNAVQRRSRTMLSGANV